MKKNRGSPWLLWLSALYLVEMPGVTSLMVATLACTVMLLEAMRTPCPEWGKQAPEVFLWR